MCESSTGSEYIKLDPNTNTRNKLNAKHKKCFLSLQDVIFSSCLSFEDQIYIKTTEERLIPISDNNEAVSSNERFIQAKDIIANSTEYLNNDINP